MRIIIVLHFFKHLLDLLLYSLCIKLISLNYMRQFTLNVKLIELFDDSWVKLRDSNFILANVDDAVRVWITRPSYLSVMNSIVFLI